MKFALVSGVLPPSSSGQSMMLHRLLAGFDPSGYCLLTRSFLGLSPDDPAYTQRLPAPYHSLDDSPVTREPLWWRRLKTFGRLFARARRLAAIVQQEACEAIVVCSGDLLDLPAAFLASRRLGLPCYVYVFDDYRHHSYGALRWFARWAEPWCLRRAAGVVVINEFLRDELLRRHGPLPVTLIRNPCSLHLAPPGAFRPIPANGEIRIVFTGAIYEAHYDAFRHLLAAFQLLPGRNFRLHLYTAVAPADLARHGIAGPIVHHGHQRLDAMPAIQQQADLLFLPLAFASPYPELIRTTSPSKMGEYMAAARPILVHSPRDSYLAWYFRQHGCGLVVDAPDPAALAAALARLVDAPALQSQLAGQARALAAAHFDLAAIRAQFAGLLGAKLLPHADRAP